MTYLGPESPGDAAAEDLWNRLVAGEIAEVCVLSYRGLFSDLPQTLGLEVITYEAYIYDTRGVVRTPEERALVARQLAAEPRWLAVGGPHYWVDAFAERAGVILVIPTPLSKAGAATGLVVNSAFDGLERGIRRIFRKPRRPAVPQLITDLVRPHAESDYYSDAPMTADQADRYFARMLNYLVGTYPEKTLQLSRERVKLLRPVRVPRHR